MHFAMKNQKSFLFIKTDAEWINKIECDDDDNDVRNELTVVLFVVVFRNLCALYDAVLLMVLSGCVRKCVAMCVLAETLVSR